MRMIVPLWGHKGYNPGRELVGEEDSGAPIADPLADRQSHLYSYSIF